MISIIYFEYESNKTLQAKRLFFIRQAYISGF